MDWSAYAILYIGILVGYIGTVTACPLLDGLNQVSTLFQFYCSLLLRVAEENILAPGCFSVGFMSGEHLAQEP